MPPRKTQNGRTQRAPGLLENPDYLHLKKTVDKLEAIVEFLIYEIPGEKGERLRKRFYGEQV